VYSDAFENLGEINKFYQEHNLLGWKSSEIMHSSTLITGTESELEKELERKPKAWLLHRWVLLNIYRRKDINLRQSEIYSTIVHFGYY
jgi:hypothetical protein